MSSLVKVQGHSNLRKDLINKGVVNVDNNAYQNYLVSKNLAKKNILEKEQTHQNLASIQDEINSMKDDVGQIKEMLLALMNKEK
jgi:hypothetical protein